LCPSLPCGVQLPVVDADGQVTVSADGKSVTTDPRTLLGLTVSHSFRVIDGPGVVRGLLKIENPGASSVAAVVGAFFNLSFQDQIVTSSSGDALWTAADRWLIARSGFTSNPPTTVDALVFYGPGSPAVVATNISKGNDIYVFHFPFTVPAGETVYLMWFLGMHPNQSSAQAGVAMFDAVAPDSVLVADLTAEQRARILNWDFPPVPVVTAHAGADRTVDEGSAVTLDGSASSGGTLSYAWTQLAGPPVSLSGANTAAPSFLAPLLPGGFGSQTLTFQLTASVDDQSSTDSVDVLVRNVNHPPVADAGADQLVNEGSAVVLSAAASFDPENDPLTYTWIQTAGSAVALTGADTPTATFTAPLLSGGVGVGTALSFQLTVSDGALSRSATVSVAVEQVNHAPTADAGGPQTVHSGTAVTLDGTASMDPDADELAFGWVQIAGPPVALISAGSATPSFTAPPIGGSAVLTFRLTVSDGLLASADDVNVTITNGVPRCDLGVATPSLLWPPNHSMRSIAIVNVTDPNDEAVTITITGVTQDEPTNGLGDGDTAPDAIIQDGTVLVRAERAGTGNGRVYRISFSADDGAGGICSGSATVGAPLNMKPGNVPVDSGQFFDATLP
jgi:hypothetical protein